MLNCSTYGDETKGLIGQIHQKIEKRFGSFDPRKGSRHAGCKQQWGQVLKQMWTTDTLALAHSSYHSKQPFVKCPKCSQQNRPCGKPPGKNVHYSANPDCNKGEDLIPSGFDDTSSRWLAKLCSIGWDAIWKGTFSMHWTKAMAHYGLSGWHSRQLGVDIAVTIMKSHQRIWAQRDRVVWAVLVL